MNTNGISFIDLGIIVVLLIFLYKGYKRGFTTEFMRISGTLISLILAVRYMSDISRLIIGAMDNIPPIVAIIISFTVIFVSSILLFKYITEKLKKAISFSVAVGGADKILGGALGLFKGAVIISLITILLSFFTFSDLIKRHISESALFDPMRRIAPLVYNAVKVFTPRPKPFLDEFEENLYGVSKYNRGKETDNFVEFYKKK